MRALVSFLLLVPACATAAPEPLDLQFASWTVGELGGVTPEHYQVEVTEAGDTLRVASTSTAGGYQSIWHQHDLPPERKGVQLATYTVRQRLTEGTPLPLVWMRVDSESGMLGMVDARSQELTAVDAWQDVQVRIAVPEEASSVVVGVGLIATGAVSFQAPRLVLSTGAARQAPSAEAVAALQEVTTLIQEHALHREQLDWQQLDSDVDALMSGARTAEDAHIAIRYLLAELGDRHSHLVEAPRQDGVAPQQMTLQPPVPEGRWLEEGIGYLTLPGHAAGDPAQDLAYANAAARALDEMSSARAMVLDLRNNGGGTMWPMLAAIGPLLGTDGSPVGAFLEQDGSTLEWWWRDGQSGYAGRAEVRPEPPHAAAFDADLALAVLIGPATASSGEAIAIALQGRDSVRFFGSRTAGLASTNRSFVLQHGPVLNLTVGHYQNRLGQVSPGWVEPDQPVEAAANTDAELEAALDWLRDQG